MTLKEHYWQILKKNIGYRQTLWDWHLGLLKAKKPTEKIEQLINESTESEHMLTVLIAKVERLEYLLLNEKSINFELTRKIIELEKQIEITKQIEQL